MQGSRVGTLVRELDPTRGHAKSPQSCLIPWDLIDCSPEPSSMTPLPTSLIFVFSAVFTEASVCYTIIFALPTLGLFHCLESMGRHHHSALNSILKMLPPWLTHCVSPWYLEIHYQISLFLLSGQRL